MKTFSERAINFFLLWGEPGKLPMGVTIMNPYKDAHVKKLVCSFY